MDRRSIEKKDFPVERRGYSSAAVDAHLSALADEVDSLSGELERLRSAPPPPAVPDLASAASEQVRSILEAAVSSAAEIERGAAAAAGELREQAGSEALATREHADSEALATRQRAADQAREQVGVVAAATETMLERLRAMETELAALRAGCERLGGELRQLEGSRAEVAEAVARSSAPPTPAAAAVPGRDPQPGAVASAPEPEAAAATPKPDAAAPEPGSAASEPSPEPGAPAGETPVGDAADPAEASGPLGGDEAEGVRLIALNMALTGTPRGETARYLQANFTLSHADRLLDEVYAGVDH